LRILVTLLQGPGSASSLSRDQLRDLSLNDVDYHLKKLESTGAIDLVNSEKVRGTEKHTYSLAASWRPLVAQVASFEPRRAA